jgi:hypothetical protein
LEKIKEKKRLIVSYQSKDVCDERHKGVNAEAKNMKEDIKQNSKDIKSINRKIDATLIFAIITLVTLIIGLLKGGII